MQLEICAGTKRFLKVEWLCVRVSQWVLGAIQSTYGIQSAS